MSKTVAMEEEEEEEEEMSSHDVSISFIKPKPFISTKIKEIEVERLLPSQE